MKTKKISFSGLTCCIGEQRINILDFKNTVPAVESKYKNDEEQLVINLSYQGDFLKIKFWNGSPMPRNPNVYSQSTDKYEENPRRPDQIEPKDSFAIFDLATSYLWLSNSKKKQILIDYFQKLFPTRRIILKDVYDKDRFINGLKTLDQIKISATPNIFDSTNSLSKALTDEMYGATEATLHLKYKSILIHHNLINKIKNIFNNQVSFNSIMISGRDENNLGMLFNNNLFCRKIDIDAEIDEENEMFNEEDIFKKIIEEIKKETREN